MEDRCRRNNVRLVGLPEGMEGPDAAVFLRANLSKWFLPWGAVTLRLIGRIACMTEGGAPIGRALSSSVYWDGMTDQISWKVLGRRIRWSAHRTMSHCCFFLTLVRLQRSGERHLSGFEEDDSTWSPALPHLSLVVGGDFNAVINPVLDKSQSDTTANPSSKLLNKFITELNLIDLWRIQNTKAKDFTFFSNRHKTFSRIDYIFLSPSLISSNSSMSILPILLSDHSAVLCSVPLSDVKAKSPRWRFNISLLSNQTFITSLKEYVKDFLEINMPSDVILRYCGKRLSVL